MAREFLRFLIETGRAELRRAVAPATTRRDPDVESLVADLLGSTLVDAQDELWTAWDALERAGSPEPARKWLTEPPPWPPASIEKYLNREGENAMSLIETLAAELSPRPAVRALADPELAVASSARRRDTLLAEMAQAADGTLSHEPRFRAWLRAEWTASARQRYRRVTRLAGRAQAELRSRYTERSHHAMIRVILEGLVKRYRHRRRGRRRIARAPAGRR